MAKKKKDTDTKKKEETQGTQADQQADTVEAEQQADTVEVEELKPIVAALDAKVKADRRFRGRQQADPTDKKFEEAAAKLKKLVG